MSVKVVLSIGREVDVRKLLAGDVLKLADYEKKSEAAAMTIHLSTKMPLEEINALEIEDLIILQNAMQKANPGLSNLGFTRQEVKPNT